MSSQNIIITYLIMDPINQVIDENKFRIRLLAIAGSPRRGGNTDTLLNEAVAGAVLKGAMVKQIILSDLDIAPCRHCDGCVESGGTCVIDDDMQWIHQDLQDYDRFIFAAPVFFMGIPSQAKAMIDRCQALWVVKYVLNKPVATKPDILRKGSFISTAGSTRKDSFSGSLATVKSWFVTLDIAYSEGLFFKGFDNIQTAAHDRAAMQEAFMLGQNIISS